MTATELHEQLLSAILAGIEANREDEFTATVEVEDAGGDICALMEAEVGYYWYGHTESETGAWVTDWASVTVYSLSADTAEAEAIASAIDTRRLERRAERALRA